MAFLKALGYTTTYPSIFVKAALKHHSVSIEFERANEVKGIEK